MVCVSSFLLPHSDLSSFLFLVGGLQTVVRSAPGHDPIFRVFCNAESTCLHVLLLEAPFWKLWKIWTFDVVMMVSFLFFLLFLE
jgi:hypothetical protein